MRCAWLGTSAGGMLGINTAGGPLADRISHLVLNDVGPVVPPLAVERIRQYSASVCVCARAVVAFVCGSLALLLCLRECLCIFGELVAMCMCVAWLLACVSVRVWLFGLQLFVTCGRVCVCVRARSHPISSPPLLLLQIPHFNTLTQLKSFLRQVYAPYGAMTEEEWMDMTVSSSRKTESGNYTLHYDPKIMESFLQHGSTYNCWDRCVRDGWCGCGCAYVFVRARARARLWCVYACAWVHTCGAVCVCVLPILSCTRALTIPFLPPPAIRYGSITCPILILRGEHSDVLPSRLAGHMMRVNRRAHLAVMPNCGHAPALNTPYQINTVAQFIAEGGTA